MDLNEKKSRWGQFDVDPDENPDGVDHFSFINQLYIVSICVKTQWITKKNLIKLTNIKAMNQFSQMSWDRQMITASSLSVLNSELTNVFEEQQTTKQIIRWGD